MRSTTKLPRLAARIRDARGSVITALTVSGTIAEINGQSQQGIIRTLQAATEELSSSADLVLRTAAI